MAAHLPTRLRPNAYMTSDIEATRHFYEDLIGMPLVASWCDSDELFGKERVYCHCFFGLADGSTLAFFQFADREDQALFGPAMPASPFHHMAVNVDAEARALVEERLERAGFKETNFYVLDKASADPFTDRSQRNEIGTSVDIPKAASVSEQRRIAADNDLERWLGGDKRSNNTFRAATHQPA